MEKRTAKNMYKYVSERLEEELGNTSLVLLDALNKAEAFKTLIQKSMDNVKEIKTDMKDDFDIIQKNWKD